MRELDLLAERVRTVFRLLKRRAAALGGPGAPTQLETATLAWLDEKGPMTPSALSVAQVVRPQTVGETLDLLEERGWVARRPHATDRRQVLATLRPAGRRALARERRLRQAWLVSELGRLSPRDRRTLGAALTILESLLKTEPKEKPK